MTYTDPAKLDPDTAIQEVILEAMGLQWVEWQMRADPRPPEPQGVARKRPPVHLNRRQRRIAAAKARK